jgi:hypothetical protein
MSTRSQTPLTNALCGWTAAVLAILVGLILWLAPNPHPPRIIPCPEKISAAGWSPAGLLLGDQQGQLARLDLSTAVQPEQISLASPPITQLTTTASGERFSAVIAGEGLCHGTVLPLAVLERIPQSDITQGRISPAGERLAFGTESGVTLWRNVSAVGTPSLQLEPAQPGRITAIQWSPSGEKLATGSQLGTVQVWHVPTGDLILNTSEPHSTILALGFTADESRLRILHFNHTLSEYDLISRQRTRQIRQQSHTRKAVFSNDSAEYLSVSRSGRVTWGTPFGSADILQYRGGPPAVAALLAGTDADHRELLTVTTGDVRMWSSDRLHQLQRGDIGPLLPVTYALSLLLVSWLASVSWRKALLFCLLLDGLRDPVRKLIADAPLEVTLAMAIPWLFISLALFHELLPQLLPLSRWPRPQLLLAAAILALLLVGSYQTWQLCPTPQVAGAILLLGWSAALAPWVGVWAGRSLLQSAEQLETIAGMYLLIHFPLVCSAGLELAEWDWRGLGGISFDWIRYRGRGLIDLISGFYRSPNLLGLHAAGVVGYSLLLASRRRGWVRAGAITALVLGLLGVLCSGRRKMLLIVAVLGLVLLGSLLVRQFTLHRKLRRLLYLTAGLSGVAVVAVLASGIEPWSGYLHYGGSLVRESGPRFQELFEKTLTSLNQVGLWGRGLGTATQGSYRWRGDLPRSWQEDGVSRLAVEHGLPGLLLGGLLLFVVIHMIFRQMQAAREQDRFPAVIFGGLTLGYLASYLTDHMTFSGDPSTAIIAALPCGILCGWNSLPKAVAGGGLASDPLAAPSSD